MRTRARTRTQAPGPLQVTMHCNDRKYAAKEAQEGSSKVFLCCLLKEKPMPMHALIKSVGRKFLEVPSGLQRRASTHALHCPSRPQ